ncbi:hypothetical protein [Methylomonas sp. 11b]|uniref:hypothetical protein n=1 Tax=Methylomonas sp. 11b TaxID=1168169 RepID=UPI00047EEF47|nr:hypothetical protein [Methylomonas sp. 11b]
MTVVTELGKPEMWANEGGLYGLVIFALFVVLLFLFGVLFFYARMLPKVLDNHRCDLEKIMDMHAKERFEWGRITDSRQQESNIRQQETNAAINAMNMAINAMAVALEKIARRHRAYDDETAEVDDERV